MNKVGRGFVKAAEFVLYLGITGAGIAGIAINGIAYKRAKDLVENYEHSQAVYSYIEEDLNNLNSRYANGDIEYSEYRDEFKALKNNALEYLYGDNAEYQEALKTQKKAKMLVVFI